MRLLWLLVNSDRGNRKQRPYSVHLLNDRRHQTALCTTNLLGICSLPQYHASHLDSWLWSLILLPTCSALIPLTFSSSCPPCVTACLWMACLTSSSTACRPLPRCLESLAASLRPNQFPQPWTDVFNYCGSLTMTPGLICYSVISLVYLRSTIILSRCCRIRFFRSDFPWTPLKVSTTA